MRGQHTITVKGLVVGKYLMFKPSLEYTNHLKTLPFQGGTSAVVSHSNMLLYRVPMGVVRSGDGAG